MNGVPVAILPLLYHSARTPCWVLSIDLHHVSHEGLYHFGDVQKRCAVVHIPNLHMSHPKWRARTENDEPYGVVWTK